MRLENGLKRFSQISLYLGLCSVHPHFWKKAIWLNAILFVPIVIQLLILTIETYTAIKYSAEFMHRSSELGAITDMVQVYGIFLLAIIQIVENLLKGKADMELRETFDRIDQTIYAWHFCFVGQNCKKCETLNLKWYLFRHIFLVLIVTNIFDLTIMLTLNGEYAVWRQSICVRILSMNMIRIHLLQIICYFGWITNRLEFLYKELNRSIKAAITVRDDNELGAIINEMLQIKQLYSRIWMFSQSLNDRFEFTILMTIVVYFISFVCGFYWILMRIQFRIYDSMWRKCVEYKIFDCINYNSVICISEATLLHFSSIVVVLIFIKEGVNWLDVTKKISKCLLKYRKTRRRLILVVSDV